MSDEVSRDDDNAPKPEEKKTGFWKRMFTGVDADELNDTDSAPAPQPAGDGTATVHDIVIQIIRVDA